MKTQLYTYDGTPLFEVALDETSSQDWSLMSDNKLSVSFELEECVVLTAGCYIDFDGTRFYLLNEYKPTMIYSSAWKYDLTLGDAASWLSITLALKTIDGEDAPIFKYTGSAAEHAAIIVANLNRRMGTDQWKVGSIISTENIAIDYSGKYCSDVLQEIVDAKNTEWWIDGMTLNIGRAEFGESITLGYMNGVLGDIVCDMAGDMRSYAYLFPIGSTRNIDPTKYGHDRLQLPSGLKSVPINPEQGVAELVEEAAFAHIYPRYEGAVSAVRYVKATNKDGTPSLIYYIKDAAIPFNPNEYEIAGLVKHITFNSGELMGQEFEVNYSADSNEFELITQWTGDIQLPGGVLVPAVGDKYVVWNITMPDVYYTIASHELLDAARAFAADAIKDVSVYKVKLDYIEVQERGLKLRPGQRVRLLSDEYFASGYYDSRITRITRNIAYPDELSVDISAVRVVGTLSRLQASIQKTENIVSQFSGQLPAVIKSNDESPANDDSVYTSAKSQKEFLNKRKGGKVDAPVTFADEAEFLNGIVVHKYIRVGNGYLKYNDELEAWELVGNLLVTKGLAWFASIDGFNPATIMDAIKVDGETIAINAKGELTVIGGGSGGSGGGLTISDLSNYLTTNKYTKQSDVETLISTALTPYALTAAIPTNNNQLANGAGYITSSALTGYATEQWVKEQGYLTQHQSLSHLLSKTDAANTYLPLSGGTISGNLTLSSANAARSIRFDTSVGSSWLFVNSGEWYVTNIGWGAEYKLIHSNNIGSYNAGSATKLQTARTIWGYSFDGTADVNGTIYNVDVIRNSRRNWIIGEDSLDGEVHIGSVSFAQARTLYNANGMLSLLANGTFRLLRNGDTPPLIHSILTYKAAPYGLLTRINTDGSVSLQAQREANDAECFRLLLNPLGGNVAVGGTTADAKLHVYGGAKITGDLDGGAWFLRNSNANNPLLRLTVGSQNYYLQADTNGVYLGSTSAVSLKVAANGDTTINGNLFVNGNVSWVSQSQRSLKNIVSEQGLSLAQLERIKPIKFYWKDGRDAVLHVGGVADVFEEVLPEVVSHWKNTLCLNYVDASFYTAASLIAPVLDHERRITEGEREREALKKDNASLKRELVIMKQMLNQLTA